ncbi:protein phosphatase 2C domain-containing protein [Butyrivibrio sp. AE2032]|uniref:protein phosphatase 2C domain-containing protein n=1 Tax=Butyrivibrio sp. AE2032 TaxID=1458463 RepID=UPI00054FF64B|nr:protein phosphatase 2C domain-containing protein [Butyrivibrio sp. AE2032]
MFEERINYFEIDEIKVPKGNFSFVYEKTHNEELFNCCLEAEKNRYSDVGESLKHIRLAIEQFGYYTRSLQLVDDPQDDKAIKETIDSLAAESKEQSRNRSKNFDASKTPRDMARKAMMEKEPTLKKSQRKAVKNLILNLPDAIQEQIEEIKTAHQKQGATDYTALLDVLYGISSDSSMHIGEKEIEDEDLTAAVKILFVAFKTYFDHPEVFADNLSPINDYYKLPVKILNPTKEKTGITEKDVFFTAINNEVSYYLIKKIYRDDEEHNSEQRNIDAIKRLWNDSFVTPDRVLRDSEVIRACSEDYQVFKLPGKPTVLTASRVSQLEEKDKNTIISDMKKAIHSLHTVNPPLPHRGLNPFSFLICETSQGLRAVLVNFETVKDFKTSAFTVHETLDKYYQNLFLAGFMAPEVLDDKPDKDYKKADIYSLGRLILYINTGKAAPSEDFKKNLLPVLKEIEKMIDRDPDNRPTIEELMGTSVSVSQSNVVEYAGIINIGDRIEQQDGLYIERDCMSMDNDHLTYGTRVDEDIWVAVFDGFGGREDGREVTEKAINTLHDLIQNVIVSDDDNDYSKKIQSVTDALEKEVADYIRKYKLLKAGSAFALAVVHDDHVYTVNMGDCSVFLIEDSKSVKMTKAHRYDRSVLKEGELYQYLGVSSLNMKIEPYYNLENYPDNSFLLLCSDGLSNYVADEMITSIVKKHDVTLVDKVKDLKDIAVKEGGRDNIAIALLEKRRNK